MILSDLFRQINSAYRGTDDDAPVVDTTDYQLWLDTTNRKISEWAGDDRYTWKSLFEVRSIGTVATGVQTYDLDDDFLHPADKLTITTTADQDVDYTIVDPSERGNVRRTVYVSGRDPQQLTFSDTILSTDPIVGGTMNLAGYFAPTDLAKAKDVVPVDDPYWLVYAVASELAFNDITYSDKAPDLVAKANNLWSGMVKNNRRGTGGNPRTVPTRVSRIVGVRGRR